MRARAVVVALGLAAGCWRSSPPPAASPPEPAPAPSTRRSPPPPRDVDVMFQQFEQFTEDMCACKDAPCVQRVADEMTRWSQEQARTSAERPALTDEDTKRAAELGERMGSCMQAAMGAGGSSGSGAGSATP